MQIQNTLTRHALGYMFWSRIKIANAGWRQIGDTYFCTVDDFGNLIPVRKMGKPARG